MAGSPLLLFLTTLALLQARPEARPPDLPAPDLPGSRAIFELVEAQLAPGPGFSREISLAASRLLSRARGTDCASLPQDWSQTVRFELLAAGIPDPHFLPIMLQGKDLSSLEKDLVKLGRQGALPKGMNSFGYALEKEAQQVRLSLILVRSLVEAGPFPSNVPLDYSQVFWGSYQDGFTDPRILVSTPSGGLIELVPTTASQMFWTKLYFPETGVYTVEVLLSGPNGTETASLMTVYSNTTPPAMPAVKLCSWEEPQGVAAMERGLLELVNRERKRRNLRPLAWNRNLGRCARMHSEEMVSRRTLAHWLPGEKRRGCGAHKQNIVMDRTLCGALRQLMSSPSHRRNILNDEAVSCGIGITPLKILPGTTLYYVTQEFLDRSQVERNKR